MKKLFYVALTCIFLSSCANRGYTLSQQIPGYDNKLNPISLEIGYRVNEDGDVTQLSQKSDSKILRNVSSLSFLASADDLTLTASALDSQYGAFFLGKSSSTKDLIEVKDPQKASELPPPLIYHIEAYH